MAMGLACVASFALWTTSWSQSLTWLGTLGGSQSVAYGVSADGSVVVGWADNASSPNQSRAFRWTAQTGMQDLGTLGGSYSQAYAVSADGSVVVGGARNASNQGRAFRWTAEGGMQDLGTLPGYEGSRWAYAVSADGSVVVGFAWNDYGQPRAFRWTAEGGMQNLGTGRSEAWGVSFDGSVVVGSNNYRAFRWTAVGGMQDLGTLGGDQSRANGVSANGSVVVGWARNASNLERAFRWTAAGGMQDLGTLGGLYSKANAVSADGSVVVGMAYDATNSGWRAFRWTAQTGMQDLNQLYASLLRDGSVLWYAYAISPDGRYIVGQGRNLLTRRTEAFLLDTGPATYSLSGRVELRDFGGDVTAIPVTVELRRNGNVVRTQWVFLDAQGGYKLRKVAPGTYDIAFKASHWLRVVVPGVTIVNADVTGVDVSLTNGDIDGDNEVTLFDFGELVAAFGSMTDDDNWNPNADLDGDEEVTLFDFGILLRNFGAIGDD
jgi:probable HAF family extracellular repeat protein